MASKAEDLREQAFTLTCHEQFRLATFIAENVGYVLVGETERRQPDVIWIDGERYKLTRENA
jgi:hypothetical protein